jgi:glycosyltransferase involved in cell wall biosynthesis
MDSTATRSGFEPTSARVAVRALPVSVIVPVRNEERNLPRCLESLADFGEVYVIDSQSTDDTAIVAQSHGAKVIQFDYAGGWPKKRQWAMDTLPLAYDWVLLVDADEVLSPALAAEIRRAVQNPDVDGYYIALQMRFLGRVLRHGGAGFSQLSLFRRGKGRFECRLKNQDASMADIEVHEHVVVAGRTEKLKNWMIHHNIESLSRFIRKHDEYSNWEARVWLEGEAAYGDLPPSLFGTQAQRRRWLRKMFFGVPGSPVFFFLYRYIFQLGFLDGTPGLIYCGLQGSHLFNVKAKIYESTIRKS